jgi:hypothetical protein
MTPADEIATLLFAIGRLEAELKAARSAARRRSLDETLAALRRTRDRIAAEAKISLNH